MVWTETRVYILMKLSEDAMKNKKYLHPSHLVRMDVH